MLKDFIKGKYNFIIIFIYSFIITISIWLKKIMNSSSRLNFISDTNIINIFQFIFILVVVVVINIFLFYIFSRIKLGEDNPYNCKKLFIFSMLLMLGTYLICFFVFFPGGSFYDTYFQLDTPIFATSQHPILYNLILNFFIVQLGHKLLNNAVMGWAIFTFIQLLFVVASISYVITWLNNKKISKKIIVCIILLFTFLPIYASYSIYAIKDVLFSIVILLYIPLLYDLIESNGLLFSNKRFNILYLIYGMLLIFIRSNGIFIYIPLTIILIIKYFKYNIKSIFIGSVFIIGLNFTINSVIENKFNITHYFKESVAIPIQQISSVVYLDKSLKKSEEEFINNLLPIDTIKSVYSRENVDEIKWHKDFNTEYLQNNKIEFINLWGDLLVRNFDIYVSSYLYQTKYYWQINLNSSNTNMYRDILKESSNSLFIESIKDKYNLKTKKILPNKIYSALKDFYYKYTNFLSEGSCFMLYLLLISILFIKKQQRYLIPFLPLLFVWMTLMISTPLASSLRYIYSFVLSLPFMIIIVLKIKQNDHIID